MHIEVEAEDVWFFALHKQIARARSLKELDDIWDHPKRTLTTNQLSLAYQRSLDAAYNGRRRDLDWAAVFFTRDNPFLGGDNAH